ncbi:MAG: TfoX/Sxy family protein [Planctomycetaceae bacterium]
MAYDEQLALRLRPMLIGPLGCVEKKMFGGVGFLRHGNMLLGIWKSSLIARVGADAYEPSLRLPCVREFDITGRPMTGWVMIDAEGLQNEADLIEWIEKSRKFVDTLPRK